ncbi:hypothetical protein BDB01DRAFT_835987 [Pilobolus umbonatus]|nr:hypothetical protein BDB01DRAFT_835987 [Pilobolus umbonatus]
MGVQDVVARINKSKTHHEPVTPSTKKKSNAQHPKGISSMMHKFGHARPPLPEIQKPLSPPESPVKSVDHQHQIPVTQRKEFVGKDKHSLEMSQFDMIASEIMDLYQLLYNQHEASREYISKLQKDVDKLSSDATKVRDYEIRVEYLALKLEQVSEERDHFENELNSLKQQRVVESPLSPAISQVYTPSDNNQEEEEGEETEEEKNVQQELYLKENVHQQNYLQEKYRAHPENYMADILNVYEEISEAGTGDDLLIFDDEQDYFQAQQTEIHILNDRLVECDRALQMTLTKYVGDLETQRLETKHLKAVVKKQDELIMKLEHKLTTETDQLLKEQVDLQAIELEDKRELLNQLLNEREDLLRRLSSHKRLSARRSSIDLLSDMVSQQTRPASLYSMTSIGRLSLPTTAPPNHPLPPAPVPSMN